MESWIQASKGKGQFFTGEMEYFPFDPNSRSRKAIPDWDYNLDNHELIANGEAVEGMEFMDLGFGDTMRKNLPCRLGIGTVSGESVLDTCKEVASPTHMVSSNCSLVEEDCRPKLWRSDFDAGSQESSLIDLKLGRLTDCKELKNNRVLKESSVVSSVGSSAPIKKARATGPYPQAAFCQVYGCNKDLSSSKDYHKRHRVCNAHSKTPKVVVNGVEQRFCQQCSRFHLLAEFDDNKRSCRRRLAGHNERRRKPQMDTLSSRQHKLLAVYQGARYSGTSLPRGASLHFANIDQGGYYYPGKIRPTNQSGNIKQADESFCKSLTRAHLLPESYLHCPEKQLNFRLPPSVTKKQVVDTALPVKDLSIVSNSGCALSLLSPQSGNLSSQPTRVAVSNPSIIQGGKVQQRVIQTTESLSAANFSDKYTPDELYSSSMNSLELDQIGSDFLSDISHRVDSKVHLDGYFLESDPLETKYNPEHASTVDLLQLSSHLQRVERQRNFIQVKPEDDESFGFLGN